MKTIIEIKNSNMIDVIEELADMGVEDINDLCLFDIYHYLEGQKSGLGNEFALNLSQMHPYIVKEFKEEAGLLEGDTMEDFEVEFLDYFAANYNTSDVTINTALPKGYTYSEVEADREYFYFMHSSDISFNYIQDLCRGNSEFALIQYEVQADGTLNIVDSIGGNYRPRVHTYV